MLLLLSKKSEVNDQPLFRLKISISTFTMLFSNCYILKTSYHLILSSVSHRLLIKIKHVSLDFVKEYENYLKLLNDNGGKNLPMQATSLPNPCATCTKIVAHLHDPAKEKDPATNSPPSEKQQGSKRDVASKTERKGVTDQNTERKANLMKMLKDKKKKDDERKL